MRLHWKHGEGFHQTVMCAVILQKTEKTLHETAYEDIEVAEMVKIVTFPILMWEQNQMKSAKKMNKSEMMTKISAEPEYTSTRVLTMESDITFSRTKDTIWGSIARYVMCTISTEVVKTCPSCLQLFKI